MQHFLLIKQADYSVDGDKINAHAAARMLLDAGRWPLWTHTPCKRQVQAGDRLAVYLSGQGNRTVVATATVKEKLPWKSAMMRTYPLGLGGIPEFVLILSDVSDLKTPVRIADCLDALSFIDPAQPKWGVRLMGGMRSLTDADFRLLTTATEIHDQPPQPKRAEQLSKPEPR